jgi:ankyrin repeat protein
MCFPGKKTLSGACESGDLGVFNMFGNAPYRDFINEDENNEFPLLCAIRSGNISIVKKIMLKGNIGSFSTLFGWTVLHEAVSSESFEMLLFLLRFSNCKAYTKTSGGYTAMHIAVYENRSDMVRILLDYIPAKMMSIKNNNGLTPLVLSVFMGNVEMVNIINSSGGLLFTEIYQGNIVFFLACSRGIARDLRIARSFYNPVSGLPISEPIDIMY